MADRIAKKYCLSISMLTLQYPAKDHEFLLYLKSCIGVASRPYALWPSARVYMTASQVTSSRGRLARIATLSPNAIKTAGIKPG